MENLDLREILKDVPRGTILYSTTHGNVRFDGIDESSKLYPVNCHDIHGTGLGFTKDGRWHCSCDGECIIFPSKDQRDWSKFCQLKIGDIIYDKSNNIISIYNCDDLRFDVAYYVQEKLFYISDNLKKSLVRINISNCRIATSTEKELFYNKLQESGYFWNDEINFLEKYKFKVGDRICKKSDKHSWVKIARITDTCYIDEHRTFSIPIEKQDEWELYTIKFDITTLKPYDKVLVRYFNDNAWKSSLFSHLDVGLKNGTHKFAIIGTSAPYCIPYKGNEHLVGTTNDCDEYYKTW